MNINSIKYRIQPNKNQNCQNTTQNFKGNFVLKSSGNGFATDILNPLKSFKCTQKTLSYINKFDLINQLKQSQEAIQEQLDSNPNLSIRASIISLFIQIFDDLSYLSRNKKMEMLYRSILAEKRMEKLQPIPYLSIFTNESAENSNNALADTQRKHKIIINNEIVEIDDFSEDPKFLGVIDKCLSVKGKTNERIKRITNLLLEYMGYDKDSVKIVNKFNLNGAHGGYNPMFNAIQINTKGKLMDNNIIITESLLHELTHMDNNAKLIKSLGFSKAIFDRYHCVFDAFLKIPKFFRDIILIRKLHKVNKASLNSEPFLYAFFCQNIIENFHKKDFYTNTDVSNKKLIEVLSKYEPIPNNKYMRKEETILKHALFFHTYYDNPDECLAYTRNEEYATLFGMKFSQLTDGRLFANQARKMACDKAEEIFGNSDISNLTNEQYDKLNDSLNEDLNNYTSMVDYLRNVYKNGGEMPYPQEEFERIYAQGNNDIEKYLNFKIFDGNKGNLLTELKNLYNLNRFLNQSPK